MTMVAEQSIDFCDAAELLRRAADGDMTAWNRLVNQFGRLIWSITVAFKLAESDAADVVQTTWLRLLEHIDRIEYPDRVGSWLAATARNECLRNLAARKRVVLSDDDVELGSDLGRGPEVDERLLARERDQTVRDAMSRLPRRWQRLLEMLMADPPVSYADISDELGSDLGRGPEVDERLLAHERDQTVRDAMSRLPRRWQRLLEMLMADPPASYADISDELELPIGSIGPTRGRCLARLRVLLEAS